MKEIMPERAWIEINSTHLFQNLEAIKNAIPATTKIIAVVKANAYGHDAPIIAGLLNHWGIDQFAVASIDEAIILREYGIKGEILILGYTDIKEIPNLLRYGLTQSIVDYEYAMTLSKNLNNQKLKVQVQIDTGLHRLGENYQNIEKLKEIYHCPGFKILGTYSHFGAADHDDDTSIQFTRMQIERFNETIRTLKEDGINVGKTHIQASYGMLNYPELEYDFVRVGMLLYGNHIQEGVWKKRKLPLQPVLSLKSRVIHLTKVKKGEYIGYGCSYVAKEDKTIATVSIGYKDGYPRNTVTHHNVVEVNGCYAPLIGKLSMDQLIIDVTGIDVKVNDVVTLIGEKEKIKAEHIATSLNGVSAELLSGLGRHLKRRIEKL